MEEEMELIEQDFLEAMFDDLLREEDEQQVYYGPPDTPPSSYQQQAKSGSQFNGMQLPKVSRSQRGSEKVREMTIVSATVTTFLLYSCRTTLCAGLQHSLTSYYCVALTLLLLE